MISISVFNYPNLLNQKHYEMILARLFTNQTKNVFISYLIIRLSVLLRINPNLQRKYKKLEKMMNKFQISKPGLKSKKKLTEILKENS